MNYYIRDPVDNYLSHFGVLGMRWGVRRYQPYSVKPRGSGKSGKMVGLAAKMAKDAGKHLNRSQKKELAKREKIKQDVVERRRQEEFERQRFEENKQRILSEGSATEIYNNRKYLSDSELARAVERLTSTNKLKSMSRSEVERAFDKIDQIMKDAGKVASWGDTGIKLYNQIAGVYNATEEGSKKPMRYVKTSSGGDDGKKSGGKKGK